jgi:hypothetical protein
MPQVTVSAGNNSVVLTYNVTDRAYVEAKTVAAAIDAAFGGLGTPFNPGLPPAGSTHGGYLYALASSTPAIIDAAGFQAVVVQNDVKGTIVLGGGDAAQSVLASNGGLTFIDEDGGVSDNTTVAAGGGANLISFAGSRGSVAAYVADDSSTLIGGNGDTYFADGIGHNRIVLGAGTSSVDVGGNDSIQLGSGSVTIRVDNGSASVTITGSSHVAASAGTALTLFNGNAASKVSGGAGSYLIDGGVGGGVFAGGSAGHNVLKGGLGSVTLFGGGQDDSLVGAAAGHNSITAAGGNTTLVASAAGEDTLVAGARSDTLSFVKETPGSVYEVKNYNAEDLLLLDKANAGSATITGADHIGGHNSTITLSDDTRITLIGYTGHVNIG